MTRSSRRPSSARALYRALEELGAAPTPDPALRPDGPTRADGALLLGILLAKGELDAVTRADPGQEPPRGLTEFFSGYRSLTASPHDDTRLRLLSHRLVRSAFETTLDDDPSPLSRAAGDAALAAAGLVDAERLNRTGAGREAARTATAAALQSLRVSIETISAEG
ncbi:hypothetical protein [Streptomyces cinereoruber]|uniref:hypothetical protein n=1 Tax=Streptomyces cinereoruber TaxID=67260 RepID=UPI00362D0830